MLRPPNDLHKADVRHYGTNERQRSIDILLSSWAEKTWNLPRNRGKDFGMRVSENIKALESMTAKDMLPQADWKQTKGKASRGMVPDKSDNILVIVDKLVDDLMYLDAQQWVTLTLYYNAYHHIQTAHWTKEQKAEKLECTVQALDKRLVRVRRYILDYWPKGQLLATPSVLLKETKKTLA